MTQTAEAGWHGGVLMLRRGCRALHQLIEFVVLLLPAVVITFLTPGAGSWTNKQPAR